MRIHENERNAAGGTLQVGLIVPFYFVTSGFASVILPVSADAATVAGLAKCALAPAPIRPGKLRLVDEMQRFCGATTPMLIPRQGPQLA